MSQYLGFFAVGLFTGWVWGFIDGALSLAGS